MQPSRTLLAAAGAVAALTPVGIALAAGSPPDRAASPTGLAAPLGGHSSVAAEMSAHASALRRREARRARTRHRALFIPPVLRRIAECESHGNPRSIGGGGMYRGAYQFTRDTWRGVGGKGDPAAASLAEQTRRAAILLAHSGPSQWPVCSR